MDLHLFASIRRMRRLGRGAVLCLAVLGLGAQGLSQAVERIAAPSHRHLPRVAAALDSAAMPAAPRSFARDDHRSIPWIGGEPAPAVEVADAAHEHAGIAAHRHALDDAGVIYVDADDATASAQPVAAAACALPATAPWLPCGPSDGHAAWRDAPRWHALALGGAPLERPPR